jgi:DnaJ homolog subfamily C member 17
MAPAPEPFDDGVDYYEFLSVPSDATEAEIQRAYRRTNLKYHPDKFKATSEISAEQAAAKLDLLQKILAVFKDPTKRTSYDQKREAKRRTEAAAQKMESDRKRRVAELGDREAKASVQVNGVKRKYNEHDQKVQDYQAANKGLGEAIMKQRKDEQARLREAAEAQRRKDTPSEPEEKHRSVKIMWVKEGDGLDIDEAALKEMCEGFGPVENVSIMKDKKRRIGGRKEKTVFGTGLIVFAALSTAQDAVRKGSWNRVESVTWAFKDVDAV